jgi:hypothetical protein
VDVLFNNYQVIGVEESNIAGSSSSAHVQTEKKIFKNEKQTRNRIFKVFFLMELQKK